jgi:hypothetical protein
VSHQDLVVIDVSDRGNPVPLGKQDHNQFGLAVQAVGDRVYVGDWAFLSVWDVDTSLRSPEADLQSSEIFFYDGVGSKSLEVTNLGADTLLLLGATLGDDRVTVAATKTEIEPGESSTLVLTFTDTRQYPSLDTELCLATNDPDEPVVILPVQTTSNDGQADLAVGQPAPDFTLTDVDGNLHRLYDNLGKPVVLAYFATW